MEAKDSSEISPKSFVGTELAEEPCPLHAGMPTVLAWVGLEDAPAAQLVADSFFVFVLDRLLQPHLFKLHPHLFFPRSRSPAGQIQ